MDWDLPEVKPNEPLSFHHICMQTAMMLSRRSTCPRGQVGVVIYRDLQILSTGYVTPFRKKDRCYEYGCHIIDGHCVRTLHGEYNAIKFAQYHDIDLIGSRLYTTLSPCVECSKLIVDADIHQVYYLKPYRDQSGIEFLKYNDIPCDQFEA